MTDLLSPAQDAVVQAAATDYVAGMSVREIARTHGCSVALLYRRFRDSGVQLRGRSMAKVQGADQLVAAYAAGRPMREICARFGVAKSTVGRLVDEAGVPRRPSGKPRRVVWDTVEAAVRGGMTAGEAAAEAGCSPRQVARLLGKLGWAWDGHQWQPPTGQALQPHTPDAPGPRAG
ncbi:helix-turn-helix domain-containing protein [Nonomuraea sp. NPDC005650]|uniref:helix-turn-helix domain-containing protein n=1 Tax=Nonomuraea sp. NPDC005650 TaxID=3157045 RepID=UPI0033AF6256